MRKQPIHIAQEDISAASYSVGSEDVTIRFDYVTLHVIALAGDVARQNNRKMYVCKKPGELWITYKLPNSKDDLLARCYPGGRMELVHASE